MLELIWLTGRDDLSEVHWVRGEVFTKEQGIPGELDIDAVDAEAEHILLRLDGHPIGTGRLYQKDGQYMFGRVSVLKEYRGQHYGIKIVENLLDRAFAVGATEVHIHARALLDEYYRRLGFELYGEHFIEAGIDHISMVARRP